MTNLRTVALVIVTAHWSLAIWHLFLAAKVLPPPNNRVSYVAVVLLTLLHSGIAVALFKLGSRSVGAVSLIFFLAALSADLYEHFLHSSLNNVFMVPPSDSTAWFIASVVILLVLEILGCLLGFVALGGDTAKYSTSRPDATPSKSRRTRFFSKEFHPAEQAGVSGTSGL